MKSFSWLIMLCTIVCISACGKTQKEGKKMPFESNHQELLNATNDIISMMEDTTEKYHEGLKSIEIDGKYGFADSLGNIIIKPQFDDVGCFNEGLASVCVGAKRIRYVTDSGDSATAWSGGKYGFIDKKGNFIVEPIYDFCNFFSQGVAVVAKDDKWGYIDRTGKEIIKLQYDRAEDFWDANGFAAVSKDDKWGLIDIRGRVIVPIKHKSAYSTNDGVATVIPFDENIISFDVYNDGRVVVEKIE